MNEKEEKAKVVISGLLKKGYNKFQIKQAMVNKGWPSDLCNNLLISGISKTSNKKFNKKIILVTLLLVLIATVIGIYVLIQQDKVPKTDTAPSPEIPETTPSPEIPAPLSNQSNVTNQTTGGSGGGGGGGGGNGGTTTTPTPSSNISINCTEDSDCGSSYSGYYCNVVNESCRNRTDYVCENPLTEDANCVVDSVTPECINCNNSCENGFCVSEGLPLELTSPIGANTKTANSDETVLLVGENLDFESDIMVYDGYKIEKARILNSTNNGDEFRDNQKIMAVIPQTMQSGTLQVWLQNSTNIISNPVLINNPEPWWIQPDKLDIGETTRIFGRNLDFNNKANIGQNAEVLISNSTNNFTLIGTIIEPNVISFLVDSASGIDYGNYNVYVKDLKFNQWYGGLNLTLEPKYQIPNYTVNVTNVPDYIENYIINTNESNPGVPVVYKYLADNLLSGPGYLIDIINGTCPDSCYINITVFGAVPDDYAADNNAFIAAFNAVSTSGGGTLFIPEGTYLIDESTVGYNYHMFPDVTSYLNGNYHVVGAGAENTIIDFNFSTTPLSSVKFLTLRENSSVQGITLKASCDKLSKNDNDGILNVIGPNAIAKDLILDADSSRLESIFPINIGGHHNNVNNVKVYSEGVIIFGGRQNQITNVTHYGMREIDFYNYPTGTWVIARGISGPAFSTMGASEIILENSKAISRWGDTPEADWKGVNRGHIKRFFSSNHRDSPIHHVYFGNNYGEVMGVPYSDGENFLFETTCGGSYIGNVTLLSEDKIYLADDDYLFQKYGEYKINNVSASRINSRQKLVPLSIIIAEGRGLGQIRNGYLLEDNRTIQLTEKFAIDPDSTSKIVYQTQNFENLIYGNDFRSKHIYCYGPGIMPDGRNSQNIIQKNNITGFPIGYTDNIYQCDPLQTSISYFNEVKNNDFSNNVEGMMVDLRSGGEYKQYQSLGSIYRDNMVRDMKFDFPIFTNLEASPAIAITKNGINTYAEHDKEKTVLGSIYEKNIVDGARTGFYTDRKFADWFVLRNNTFLNIYKSGLNITNPTTYQYVNENIVNTLSQIDIIDAGDYVDYQCSPDGKELQTKCYIWSRDTDSHVILNITDPENDLFQLVSASSNADIVMSGNIYNLSWNLENGYHLINVSASDGKETRIKTYHLFIGHYDPFDTLSFGPCAADCNYSIQTAVSNYSTTTTIAFNQSHNHNINILNSGNPFYTGVLRIRALREEVSLKGNSNDSLADNAVISFNKDLYDCKGSYIKIRLKLDDQNYYEFYDDCGGSDDPYFNPYLKLRHIIKVIDGNSQTPVLKSEIIAAHSFETPFIFKKNGNQITASLIDSSIELFDPEPLQIKDWEILVAGRSTINNSWEETYVYSDFDNLYFHKSDSQQYSPQVEKQDNLISFIMKLFGKAVLELKGITGKVVDIVFKR